MHAPVNPERIAAEFDLGRYQGLEPIGASGRGIFVLSTPRGRFLLKSGKDEANAALYAEVEQRLNSRGIRQARLFQCVDGAYLSSSGYAVYEYIDGTAPTELNSAQFDAAVEYLAIYSAALADVAIPHAAQRLDDPWNQAASLDFLCGAVPRLLDSLEMTEAVGAICRRSVAFLDEHRALLHGEVQLVHGDPGPDNFLFADDAVIALIDFSPHVAPALFSLGQFLFWTALWPEGVDGKMDLIQKTVSSFNQARRDSVLAPGQLHGFLAWSCAYRLLGPLLAMQQGGAPYRPTALQHRAELLEAVTDCRELHFVC